jgi:putative CocE/NonD family hydrolase
MSRLNVKTAAIVVEHNAPIDMRDGTRLRADIHRAAEGGPFPVLLVRTPYGEVMTRTVPVLPAIEAGFAVVLQHCRGTGSSDGDFVTFEHEADDGLDTVQWCARQSWSDGNVSMYGASYLGMVQLAIATQAPPALRGLVMVVTPADYHWGLAYRQGAFQFGQALGWHTMKSAQQLAYSAAAGEDVSADMPALLGLVADPVRGYAGLPLRDAPLVSRILPSWRRWLEHEEWDGYWSGLSYRDTRDRVATPAMHVGGWYDLFLGGTLDNFTTLTQRAATEHARRNQRLVVGPWTHIERTGVVGELHYGPAASDVAIQLERLQLDFLRRTLASDGQPVPGPAVRIFVMGDNAWRDEQEWPLARTQWTRWFLHADGSLSPSAPPGEAQPSRYTYDPHDPVPSVGGSTLFNGRFDWLPGPRDQRTVEARADVLSFTSEVLAADLEVTGPVTVTLHAATSAADTDFTAKLVDVWPDGRALCVVDGIVRARFRDGTGRAKPVIPGEIYEYTIDLIATSQVFKAGHRLRVDIASANFPCFDRNPGNGAPAETATEQDFVVAEQTVRHDATHPSFVTLPVIPR